MNLCECVWHEKIKIKFWYELFCSYGAICFLDIFLPGFCAYGTFSFQQREIFFTIEIQFDCKILFYQNFFAFKMIISCWGKSLVTNTLTLDRIILLEQYRITPTGQNDISNTIFLPSFCAYGSIWCWYINPREHFFIILACPVGTKAW